MPNEFKLKKGHTRYILRKYLNEFLPKKHAFRLEKANLSHGLISNFSKNDLALAEDQFRHMNKKLEAMVETELIKNIIIKSKKGSQLNETEIINLMLFINVNIFLNSFDEK